MARPYNVIDADGHVLEPVDIWDKYIRSDRTGARDVRARLGERIHPRLRTAHGGSGDDAHSRLPLFGSPRRASTEALVQERSLDMARPYNVIDADGHVLEPVDIWDKYIDPAFRERAPKIIVDTDGKERLRVGEQVLGSQKGFGVIGAIGSRDHEMPEETMKYIDGRKGGFDPHARIPDMDLDGIDAAFLYPSVGLFSGAIRE